MLGGYSKRRSTQRPSTTVEPLQSPQFGESDNVGFREGGGTGGPEDDDELMSAPSARQSGASRQRSPSSNATPFDERVKSVRSRIREMVAVAGEDSSDASETYESNPMRKASALSRGSKSSNARSSAAKTAEQGIEESKATPKKRPKPKQDSVVEGQLVGRDGAPYVGAKVRVLDPKVARYVEPTGVVVEVRCEGERVRVEHDGPDKAQRYYNTGKNGEFQLEFEKVNDGIGNRRTAPAVADSSDEDVAPTPTPKPKVKAAAKRGVPHAGVTKRASKSLAMPDEETEDIESAAVVKRPSQAVTSGGSRSSKAPASAPDEDLDDIEINAVAKKSSRYSQLREKRHSTCQEPGSPVVASIASSPSRLSASKIVASSPRPESSPDPEGRAKIPYSQRRSMRFSQAEAAEVAAVVAKVADRSDGSAPSPNGDSTSVVSSSTREPPGAVKSSKENVSKAAQSSKLDDGSGAMDQLKKDQDDLLTRLRTLEQSFAKDLGLVQADVNRQIEIAEQRIVARVLEELESRLRQATKTALADPAKPAKLSIDAISSRDPPQQGVGTPVNYEPEQEYAESDLSECQPASSSRRPSEVHKSYVDEALQKVSQQTAAEESKEELADNRQRLANIGNVARSITGSLGGREASKEPIRQTATRPENDGAQTPDFAASFSGSPSQNLPTSDGLDAEMARLADLRRFASNVMKAAEVQSQMMPNTGTPAPATWTDPVQHGWPGSSLAGQPHPEAQAYASSHQMGLRDSANHQDRQGPPSFGSADVDHYRMNPGGGRRSMPAQMPGVPPWADNNPRDYPTWDAHGNPHAYSPRGVGPQPPQQHHASVEASAKQQFFRPGNGGKGARHSFNQPRPTWPAAPNGPPGNEWDCTPAESEGRLVF